MTKENQQFLLKLARQTLEYYFETGGKLDHHFHGDGIDEVLKQKRGTFVTLTKHGELRGCIGHIEPIQAVYKDVIDNTLSAAFEDNRFAPLQEEELTDIKIEISILSNPERLSYFSLDDLINKLRPMVDGVIIEKGRAGATYLPQVWEKLPDKELFLSSLCEKADLPADEWKTGGLDVYTYQAEVFDGHISHIT